MHDWTYTLDTCGAEMISDETIRTTSQPAERLV
jgi:hypothetical protein